jgi:protease-4
MQESIFRSFLRGFFTRFGSVTGIILAIFFSFIIIGIFSSKGDKEAEIKTNFSPYIQPNANDVRKELAATSPVVLKLNIQGVIGTEDITRQKIKELLVESREKTLANDRVKAVLLCLDTPGGTVIDADGIYRLIKDYKERHNVPVYAYVDGLCASGGMYVACAADKIYANDSSLIGSIGVIVPSAMNFTKLLDKFGVESLTISAGKGKDELNPFRPWGPDEGKNYQELVDDFYTNFVGIVTDNRPKVSKEKLINEYGAHVFTSPKAVEIGFIDGSGYDQNKVLEELAAAANLTDGKYQVIELKQESFLMSLFKSEKNIPLLTGEVHHRLDLGVELDPKLINQFLYLYR